MWVYHHCFVIVTRKAFTLQELYNYTLQLQLVSILVEWLSCAMASFWIVSESNWRCDRASLNPPEFRRLAYTWLALILALLAIRANSNCYITNSNGNHIDSTKLHPVFIDIEGILHVTHNLLLIPKRHIATRLAIILRCCQVRLTAIIFGQITSHWETSLRTMCWI